MAEDNINLNCAVCDRLQSIEWAMGGFLLVPGSGDELVTEVICQPCAPGDYAQSLMAANRKWNGGTGETWQAIKDSLPPNLYPVVFHDRDFSGLNLGVGIFKKSPGVLGTPPEPPHYY
jgi:hypothetical protein